MKNLIILILISINLVALDFGKDVDIARKWYIRSVDDVFFMFMVSAGNKWIVEFKKDGYIYDISEKNEKKQQLKWKYTNKNGEVNINFDTKADGKELFELMFFNHVNDFIKIIKQIDENCFLVNVTNKNQNIYMCKIYTKKEKQKIAREKAERNIKIEMK